MIYNDEDGKKIEIGTEVWWKDGFEMSGVVIGFEGYGWVKIQDFNDNDIVSVHMTKIWQED